LAVVPVLLEPPDDVPPDDVPPDGADTTLNDAPETPPVTSVPGPAHTLAPLIDADPEPTDVARSEIEINDPLDVVPPVTPQEKLTVEPLIVGCFTQIEQSEPPVTPVMVRMFVGILTVA
jgi:hypothetical protein